MAFSVFVEVLNLRAFRKHDHAEAPVKLHAAYAPPADVPK
jgi:hypothetical protein